MKTISAIITNRERATIFLGKPWTVDGDPRWLVLRSVPSPQRLKKARATATAASPRAANRPGGAHQARRRWRRGPLRRLERHRVLRPSCARVATPKLASRRPHSWARVLLGHLSTAPTIRTTIRTCRADNSLSERIRDTESHQCA